ncbi:DEAD/DEAH box helicase [Rubinisphaera italica]|uniref:Putative DEAD-box ATP-dependent RNA helicase n=1 Tax=Rubinisphaera italica TaxID=2527969 RepID=A0A5C5XKG6_9PLAN|nr:DEAD/DEAH box helicase [Rubinisphaera italica]TWT63354.1 putative DEAD-box ATP-dependent RNA helicase [Rubinisphaera italica]
MESVFFDQSAGTFADLGLKKSTVKHLEAVGYLHPSEIQQKFIPPAVTGADCLGQSQTGTGKTAAFMLPVIERLEDPTQDPQVLVLCPTRELSEQVAEETRKLCKDDIDIVVVVGGRPLRNQMKQVEQGVDIVVGTPGRVIDLFKRKSLSFAGLKTVVLDEADRMLDIGFRPDMEYILKNCPKDRQTLLLSATLPPEVERLSSRFMRDPIRIDISVKDVTSNSVDQFFCTVDNHRKLGLLVKLLRKEQPQQAIVFCRTRRKADELYNRFKSRIKQVAALHGDLPQAKRDRVMQSFRDRKVRLLIATDIVGRGIDVGGISHIINYDIPEHSDDYVHRVGRAGRLSSDFKGRAFTFVTKDQGGELTRIEMLVNRMIPEYTFEDFDSFEPRKRRHV